MLLMDELDYMRLYPAKRKVHIPVNLENKRKGAAIMLLTQNSVDSHTLMNMPYVYNPQLYKALYIDRNVNAMIDSGAIIDEPEEPVTEAMQHVLPDKKVVRVFDCKTGSKTDENLMRSIFTENRFLKWYRYFKAKEKDIVGKVKIIGFGTTKELAGHFIHAALDDKRSGILMNSYSTPEEIGIVTNSGYGPIKTVEGPNWEKYAENELITNVIMNSCKNCSRYLAGQVAAVLSGQFDKKKAEKCEEFGDVEDEGLATCYVIYQLYKEQGQRGIIRLCKSGDVSILAAYASKRFIQRMKTTLGINESTINEGIIFNSKDITSNINRWGDSPHNILYICGLSGGGKSTDARRIAQEQDAILVELDILERAYNFAREDKENNRYDMNIVRKYWKENHLTKDPQSMNDDEYMKYWYGCWDYILKDMQSQDKLFVVEGVQMIRVCKDHNPELVNEPFIIKGTSLLTSIERRIKREGIKSALVGSAGGIKGVIGRLNWYFDQEYSLGCLRKAVRGAKQESAEFNTDSADLSLKADILDLVDSLSDKEREDIALNGVYNTEDPNISKTIVRRDEDGKVIGFLDLHNFSDNPNTGFITLAVSPNYRRQGIGRAMVDDLLHSEPAIPNINKYIWHVDPENISSVNLAKRCGFIKSDVKRHRADLDIYEDQYEYTLPFRESVKERIPLPYRVFNEADANFYLCNEEYITDGKTITFFKGMNDDVIQEAEKKYDTKLKRFLFNQRLKNNKMVSLRYEEMKAMNPWITKTYLKLAMYKGLNTFIDLSYYHGLFMKNLNYKRDIALNMYWDFLNRLINDQEYKDFYRKITIFIPVWGSAWNVESVEDLVDYTKSINPISLIFRYLRKNPAELKKWGNKDIVFIGTNGYFKVNFNTIAIKDISKFKRLITKVFNNEDIAEEEFDDGYGPREDIETDSPAAITASLISSIEKHTSIKIDDITGDNKDNQHRDESLDPLKPTGNGFTHLRIRTGKFVLPHSAAAMKINKPFDYGNDDELGIDSKNAVIFISPSEDKSVEAFLNSNIDVHEFFGKKGFYKP